MKHEKIFVRRDGTKCKIIASISIPSFGFGDPQWNITILICLPKKRSWYSPIDTSSHRHRCLSFPEGREADIKLQMLLYATEEEMMCAKLELWEKLKPVQQP